MRYIKMMLMMLLLYAITLLTAIAANADQFNDEVCVPLEVIAHAVAQHASEGTYTEVESVGDGVLHIIVGVNMTVWAPHPVRAFGWCIQPHLGGQGV